MSITFLVCFLTFVALMLALDLGVVNRKAHAISVREALAWSVAWVSLAMLFNLGIYFFWASISPDSALGPREAALAFFTGYVIEESLSMDNVFVFVLIFSYFRVPSIYQHRVLFWGVTGAIVMRGLMIGIGTTLVQQFEWILYIFGAFLVFTGIRMALQKDENPHPENNPLVRLARKFLPIAPDYDGKRFWTRHQGRLMATPLFLTLIVVESSDLLFATDSIPAVFSITKDATIVFTSNIFAIMGLRSMYFVLAGMVEKFHHLKTGLAVVLTFVGLKMLVEPWVHIGIPVSLAFIALALGGSIAASMLMPRPGPAAPDKQPPATRG
ncbi:MAG: TerC family protein [Opitutales bacterium]